MSNVIYGFGDFELDVARFELRCSGTRIEVQPKVLRLLLHLVEQRERTVGGDELLRVVWPDEKVGPGSIKRAVSGARHVLGDRDDRAHIRTVRGYGYSFVGVVEVKSALSSSGSPDTTQDFSAIDEEPNKSFASGKALLGREGALGLLHSNLQQALSGVSRCVLITGGPGLGKTRTLETFAASARALGADSWLGRATDLEGVPAFWPFTQVLRDALRDRGAAQLRVLLGSEGADVAEAIEELRVHLPDLPASAPLSSPSARFRVFDGVGVFLRRAADQRPVVVALDDLHRADPATLRLLSFVVRQVRSARLLILCAYQPDLTDNPELARLLEELTRQSSTSCIPLQGLSEREIALYLTHTTGSEPPDSAVRVLHEQTAGNPLFMHHLIENWRTGGEPGAAPAWQTVLHTPQSQGLTGAIERHIDLVSTACRDALRAAAVLGSEFSAGLLARMGVLTVKELCIHLGEAAASGLVRELVNEFGQYRFTHGLVRAALYNQLSPAARSALHGRAAAAIEAQGIGDNHALLYAVTRHYVQAAPAYDAGRALQFSIRCAEGALSSHAYEQAAEHFERALGLLQYQDPNPGQRMRLLLGKGDALARIDLHGARAALFEAAGLARELEDRDGLTRAATLLASAPESGAVDANQVEVVRQALTLVAPDDDRHAVLQALLAKSLSYANDPRERVSLAREALARSPRLESASHRGEVLRGCHEALQGPEYWAERVTIANELMSLGRKTDDTVALLRALAAQVETSIERGDMAAVDRAVDTMESLTERVREPFFRWYCKVVRAMRCILQGDLVLGERLVMDAARTGATVNPDLAHHVHCVQQSAVLRLRGQYAQAAPLMREMTLRYPTIPGWDAALGCMLWATGQRDAARSCFVRLMERGAECTHSEPSVLSSFAALAELCAKVADANAAQELYAALLPFASHHGMTYLGAATYGPMTRYLALLAECLSDFTLADQHFRAALQSSSAMGSPVLISGVQVLYARLLLRAGNPQQRTRAVALVQSACECADELQLLRIAAGCRILAKRHNISLEPRSSRHVYNHCAEALHHEHNA